MIQRGRCRHCGAPIPLAETWIELATAIVTIAAVLALPSAWPWLVACGWLLILLAAIDQLHGVLPDELNVALLVVGLISLLFDPSAPRPVDGLVGGLAGAAVFGLVALVYRRWRGRDGLGGGDVKLLGAIGVWVGLFGIAWVVVLAASAALTAALIQDGVHLMGERAIRFGPWLAGAGFSVALLMRYWGGLASSP